MTIIARCVVGGALCASLLLSPAARLATAGTAVGDGSPESCDYVAFATAFAAGGLITFNCGPNPHIIILEANDGVVNGPGKQTTVDGGGLITLSAANVSTRRHFLNNAAALTLTRLSLVNSAYNDVGGAILNYAGGTLVLDEVRIEYAGVQNDKAGGAIFNLGQLEIRHSTFAHNSAFQGGAIFNAGGGPTALIEASTFYSNVANGYYGGAISNHGVLTVTASTFSGNEQPLATACPEEFGYPCGGGAIANRFAGILTVEGSTFSGNASHQSGGAILNNWQLNVADTSFSDNRASSTGGGLAGDSPYGASLTDVVFSGNTANHGGGMYTTGPGAASLTRTTFLNNSAFIYGGGLEVENVSATVTDSTFHGNSASWSGGGIALLFGGVTTMTHVTLSENTAEYFGAGIFIQNAVGNLRFVTLAGNHTDSPEQSGGIFISPGSELNLKNVLLASNGPVNCAGEAPTSATFNVSSDSSCFGQVNGNQINALQTLGPLANNGGATLTHMITAGGPAHDHGQCIAGLNFDQRGLPRLVGAGCDVGAVERQAVDFGWYAFLPFTRR